MPCPGSGTMPSTPAVDLNGEANLEESVRDTLTYLKSLGIDLELRNHRGQTPLARALAEGTVTEVKVLCEIGADVNASGPVRCCDAGASDTALRPLLFLAAASTAVDPDQKVEALLQAGADPLADDGRGGTPLDAAVANLCAEADEPESVFRSYYEGLRGLRVPTPGPAGDRERFIASVRPVVEEYTREFSERIPVASHEYAARHRGQTLRALAALASAQWWARRACPTGPRRERA